MSIAYLNGEYLPLTEARISPLDRGFLFGDGIYEVIPSYAGKLVGFTPHMRRMQEGLTAIRIPYQVDIEDWRRISQKLSELNGGGDLGIYFQISRGADSTRNHLFPSGVEPTVFGFTFPIPAPPRADKTSIQTYRTFSAQDKRWRRCHIKSTALLGNVLHYQFGHDQGGDETLLYNERRELTEAAACNVFIVKNGVIATPGFDEQKLPGITRLMLLDMLRDGRFPVEERVVQFDEVVAADEIWLTSSSKEVAPVVELDGRPVGNGEVGDVWLAAQSLFCAGRYDY